jgi:hypothetical protein
MMSHAKSNFLTTNLSNHDKSVSFEHLFFPGKAFRQKPCHTKHAASSITKPTLRAAPIPVMPKLKFCANDLFWQLARVYRKTLIPVEGSGTKFFLVFFL